MINLLYGNTDLIYFEDKEFYDLHGIEEWNSKYVGEEDVEDLVYGLAGPLNFVPNGKDIELRVSNLNDDENVELFGDGAFKEMDLLIGDDVVRFHNDKITYINIGGKVYESDVFTAGADRFDRNEVRKAQVEYYLFMIRVYGEEYKKDLLERLNLSLFTSGEITRLYNELPKSKTTNI